MKEALVSFRCSESMKNQLVGYAEENELHVSQVIRVAVKKLLGRESSGSR
jgi:antitoxin component of RelBE/YafQ-DinJ toxin-antitoxin module